MRFLFASFGHLGFLHPLLGIALELRRRGHTVAFATAQSARAVLGTYGVARIPRLEADGDSFDIRTWGDPLRVALDVKHLDYAIGRMQPDVVVSHQLCQAAVLCRERTRIPLAVLGLATYMWPPVRPIDGVAPAVAALRRGHLEDHLDLLERARALFGLPRCRRTPEDVPLLGDIFLLRTVPELEPALTGLPPQVHTVGAALWEPTPPPQWEARIARIAAQRRHILYVEHGRTFGTPGFWPFLMADFSDGEYHVVASIGRMGPTGPPPHNFTVGDHVPHSVVLPHSVAVICSATTTPILNALTHGLPSILVSLGGEGMINAAQLAGNRCAIAMPPPEALQYGVLRCALDQALHEPVLRNRCRELRDAFRSCAGSELAADLIERLPGRAGSARATPRAAPVRPHTGSAP